MIYRTRLPIDQSEMKGSSILPSRISKVALGQMHLKLIAFLRLVRGIITPLTMTHHYTRLGKCDVIVTYR